jgi:hypothetical protein
MSKTLMIQFSIVEDRGYGAEYEVFTGTLDVCLVRLNAILKIQEQCANFPLSQKLFYNEDNVPFKHYIVESDRLEF